MIESVWVVGVKRLSQDNVRQKRIKQSIWKGKRRNMHKAVVKYSQRLKSESVRQMKKEIKVPTPPWVSDAEKRFPHWFGNK